MQWSRPAWPIRWELLTFAIVMLGIAAAAGVWRLMGW